MSNSGEAMSMFGSTDRSTIASFMEEQQSESTAQDIFRKDEKDESINNFSREIR
jgi:hypothetical protein